jgi:pimeloyl-ACP methyl ester carboxylesterase
MPMTPKHNDIALYYEIHDQTTGPGAPLLLISGTGHDRRFWAGQSPSFAGEYRTIVFDNRGVGQSSVPPPGYSLADMADDAARVLDAAGAARAHVMGFSMGGHIAQELTLRHPERVASLGIHHSWARNSPRLRDFQATRRQLAALDQRIALAEISLLALHSHDYYNAHADAMAAHRAFLLEQSPVNAGWIGQLEACLTGDTWDRLPRIAAPTLVTCSDLDIIAAPHHAREIAGRIPGARLVELKGTGHVALMERPAEFAELCLGFLREQPSLN